MKIDNEYLAAYLKKDNEVKEAKDQLNEMKKNIEDEVKKKGNVIKTRDYLAAFELITRSVYDIPEDIKDQYKTVKEYDRLIIIKTKP